MPRDRFARLAIEMTILILGTGCKPKQTDKWGAIVSSTADIQAAAPSTTSVRARGLADEDIPSLAFLPHLQDLDFFGGWAVERAKLTDKGLHHLSELDLPCLNTLFLGFI